MKRSRKGWPPNSHRYAADRQARAIDDAVAGRQAGTLPEVRACPWCDRPLTLSGRNINPRATCNDEACFGNRMIAILLDDAKMVGAYNEIGRDERQAKVSAWCFAAFGAEHATNLPQRGIRHAEEAIELAQAAGAPREMVHRLVDYIYDRPPGDLAQEIGGSGLTLLALAAAAGLSADHEEAREVARVLAKPLEHFTKRNENKNAAGFNTVAPKKDGQ